MIHLKIAGKRPPKQSLNNDELIRHQLVMHWKSVNISYSKMHNFLVVTTDNTYYNQYHYNQYIIMVLLKLYRKKRLQ